MRATEDRVVPVAACKLVMANAQRARVVEFVAPHFLLQTVPHEAARVVDEFMKELTHAL
jgi:hypothetical protein